MYALFAVQPPSENNQYNSEYWIRFRLVLDAVKKEIPATSVIADNIVLLELAKHSHLLGRLIYNAENHIRHTILYFEQMPTAYLHN